ncbi:chloride channel protein [Companilactobacillus sp. FL22-1]|uniref:chloride channel protein n=1 Tax=Companilactobacillus sp. FL22-1 TaxID=3373892 RepID=UPI00375404D8
MIQIKRLAMFGYGLYLSAVIGVIAAAFLILEGLLSDLIWTDSNHIFQTILIIIGSGFLYFLLSHWPNLPKTAHDSLIELKQRRTIDYQDVFLNLLVTLVVLVFGAGVGPEAALLSAIISLSIWQADNLRYLYFQYDELKDLPKTDVFKRLFNPFKYRQSYDEKLAPKQPKLIKQKKLLYVVFAINGVLAFGLLLRQTDQPSFITKLGQSHWQIEQLWIVPVLMIVIAIFGKLIKVIYQILVKQLQRLEISLTVKIFIGMLGIILVSYLAPDLLFSGQHSLHLLTGAWSKETPEFLLTMALLKLIFLAWCLNLNWRGGDIFPITFAAMTLGFAVAKIVPQFDMLLVTAVVATTLMSVLLSPLVSGIFLLFFFPITLSPIIIGVALIMYFLSKLKKYQITR